MAGLLRKIGSSFVQLWAVREELSLRNIRPSMVKYSISYTLVLLLVNMQFQYLILETSIWGIPGSTFRYVSHIFVSVFMMLLWNERFKPIIRFSTVIMAIGLMPFLFLPQGILKTVFACICWGGLGGCVTAARCGFGFAANNAERLVGVFITYFVTGLFYLFKGLYIESVLMTHALPLVLAIGIIITLNLYREDEVVAIEEPTTSDKRTVYFAMAYMVAYYAVDAFLMIPGQENYGLASLGVGFALAPVLFVIVLLLFKKSIWHVWNIFFVIAIAESLVWVFPPPFGSDIPKYMLSGLVTIGGSASLYMLGGVQKRFSSIKLLKKCTIMLILFVPVAIISADMLTAYLPEVLPFVALILILGICMIFMLLSPLSFKYLFSVDWIDDFRKRDMSRLKDKVKNSNRFENRGLTPRETEVAELLLLANTVRMIAGELRISQSTVNMHTSNLYRKLGINSKAELFKLFGVSEDHGIEN